MDHLPLVSCMVISYNQEDFIQETLDSILAQDYDNFEIIVSDDASTDATPQILARYQQQYPDKIKVLLNQKNGGITQNSNRALKACAGEYLAVIGGDDLWLPHKISRQIAWFNENPDSIVCYHDVEAFDSKSNSKLYNFSDYHHMRTGTAEEIINYGCFASACSIIIKRISCPDLTFNDNIPHVSDWFYVLEALLCSNQKIGFIQGIYARYRRHNNNITLLKDLNAEFLSSYLYLAAKYPEKQSLLIQAHQSQLISIFFLYLKSKNPIKAMRILCKSKRNLFHLSWNILKRIKEKYLNG